MNYSISPFNDWEILVSLHCVSTPTLFLYLFLIIASDLHVNKQLSINVVYACHGVTLISMIGNCFRFASFNLMLLQHYTFHM